ncbi:DUF6701 domain-containing protein [Porticoccus sp. GXU_MW_L64]
MTKALSKTFVLLPALALSGAVQAADCIDVFPDGASNSNGSGDIDIFFNSQILGSPDNILDTTDLNVTGGNLTCGTANCTASGSNAATGSFNSFANVSNDINVGFGATATASPGNYDDMNVSSSATLNLQPGTYLFRDDVNIDFGATINITGPGTVRILVRDRVNIGSSVTINAAGGDRRLFLYARDDIVIGSSSSVNGVIYGDDNVTLNSGASVTGAITSERDVRLNSASTITYNSDAISGTDFGDFCTASVVTPPPAPVAEWRLDELSWNGTSGEVLDSVNSHNGTAVRTADSNDTDPAIAGDPGTCRYGDFTPTGFVSVPYNADLNPDNFTVSLWARVDGGNGTFRSPLTSRGETNGFNTFGFNLYAASDNTWQFWTALGQTGFGWDVLGGPTVNNGVWTHIAASFERTGTSGSQTLTGIKRLYINGAEVNSATNSIYRPMRFALQALLTIGAGGQNGNNFFFNGAIDEVRIYDSVLTSNQIQTLMNETRTCAANGPDHYSITAANGVACDPIPVTVAAHDNNHNPVDAQGATVTLTTSTGRGTWSGSGVVDTTPGDGIASLSFPLAASSADITLSYTDIDTGDGTPTSDTFTVTVTDGAIDNAPDRPTSTVNLSGFVFGTGNFTTGIPNQAAGVSDNSLRLRAVQTDLASGACTALYPNQTRAIGFAASYRNPTAGAGISPSINGQTIDSFASGAAITSYSNQNLAFDADSIAVLNFIYNDVGQLQLHARDGSGGLTTAQGTSNDFVIRPHHFDTTVTGNPGTTTTGSGFVAAGAAFSATVSARANGGAITPNYGNETSPESVSLAVDSLVMPVGGNSGNLSGGTASGGSGSFTVSGLSWSEVGTVTLVADVADGDYLGAGPASNPQPSGNVGRFYPADFALTSASTSNGCGDFTYLGQPNISVSYNLTARNSAGATTNNYAADSDGIAGTLNYPVATISHNAQQGANDLSARLVIDNAEWVNGVYALNTPSATVNRQASTIPDGPFASVQLSLTEDDVDTDITGSRDIGTPLNLRFGRAVISDAHGPESTLLNVPFGTEYWDGSLFAPSLTDSCSVIATDQIQFDNTTVSASPQGVDFIGGAGADSTGTFFFTTPNAQATGGTFGLVFSPPGAGNTGSFPININLTNYPWLRSDWNQDGNHNDPTLPEATVSFGSYRGHDRVIYWRERFD